MVEITVLRGSDVKEYIPELARLRIRVFREYPYLYEGSSEYEEKYLAHYAQSEDCLIVIARDGKVIVGVSTGMPFINEGKELWAPFEEAGFSVEGWYYFAESVLLPEYRGQGIGKRFMEERIRGALDLGYKNMCFCSVLRPDAHPLRPADYQPLDGFWNSMGFHKQEKLITHFSWKETGEDEESSKVMVYWIKQL